VLLRILNDNTFCLFNIKKTEIFFGKIDLFVTLEVVFNRRGGIPGGGSNVWVPLEESSSVQGSGS